MSRKILVLFLAAVLMLSAAVVASAEKKVSVLGVWGGAEKDAFMKMVEPFEAATGIRVDFTGTRDLAAILTTRVAAGNPPDVSALPNPGQLEQFAKIGALVDLATFMDMPKVRSDYAKTWLDLASYKGKLYGFFISADLKSLVWYNPKAFASAGYKVPETWDELLALSDKIVADGKAPWAVGLESGAASGWPGTDWIEDIMLRSTSPEVYDEWVGHQIPWTDPRVKRAFQLFGRIARNEKYLYGGTTGALTANFGDAPNALFTTPPNAYMHRQATFIKSFILKANPDLVAGVDFNFFPFPPIDAEYGTPALGAADLFSMFNDTPEARALMRYLITPGAQEIWVAALGKLSANGRVNPNAYPDELTRKAAEILVGAKTFRFDGSDLMPAAVGAGTFWSGILDYVGGENLDTVLEAIEASAVDAYKE
ncbi:carbohydrate ABC transporter substrate-binding protein [Candidatus Aerophobetes bacterium]|uniref:Carbohydrate ABC transporter substrate-binding protein n=1 Tax=Aerophobetes bacterium TaxID=2030807 RepID=A0A523QKB0_UNCAE|nr:MAG: carbohydrate ABC transporter substrate-binding protein [Candidatus Aerophobetes bacterium]